MKKKERKVEYKMENTLRNWTNGKNTRNLVLRNMQINVERDWNCKEERRLRNF